LPVRANGSIRESLDFDTAQSLSRPGNVKQRKAPQSTVISSLGGLMPKVKCESLIRDHEMYPRTQIDNTHVRSLVMAIQTGEQLPAIKVDRKTKRIVDGFHRHQAHIKAGIVEIEVEWVNAKNDQDFFAMAAEANSRHGRPYSPFDRARIRQRAEDLGLEIERVSHILRMPLESLIVQKEQVFARDEDGKEVPLKRTFIHKAGEVLNPPQIETNRKSGGMNISFYANQISDAIESDLVNWESEGNLESLARLYENLRSRSKKFAKAA
jgi:ParB-like nuclease family protein